MMQRACNRQPLATAVGISLSLVLMLAGCAGSPREATAPATSLAPPSPSQPVSKLKSIPLDLCGRFTAAQLSSMMVDGRPTEQGDGLSEKGCTWLSIAGGDLSLLTVTVDWLPDQASAQDLYAKNRAAADAQYAGAVKSADLKLAQPADAAYLQVYSIPGPGGKLDGVAELGALDSNLVYTISLQAPGSQKARVSAVKAAFAAAYVA